MAHSLNFFGVKIVSLSHDNRNDVYSILTENNLEFYSSIDFKLTSSFPEPVLSFSSRVGGCCILITKDNKIRKIDIFDRSVNESIESIEGKIEEVKFCSNGLFFAAKLSNPYSLVIWDVRNPVHLFTFNENNLFSGFVFEGGSSINETYSVCYYEDYAKIYDCSGGCFL